jgi:hypothetical protein
MRSRYLEASRRAAHTQASFKPLWSLTQYVVLNVSCHDGRPEEKEAFGVAQAKWRDPRPDSSAAASE